MTKYEAGPRTQAVLGMQFGDEGKGTVVATYAREADVVVRFNGGGNAGHTLYTAEGKKVVMNDAPSGMIFPHVTNVIANGCVLNLETLARNISGLETKLFISDAAHLVLPYHSEIDKAREQAREKGIGTTGKGIGPAYADKAHRIGIRAGLLKRPQRLEEVLAETLEFKNQELQSLGSERQFSMKEILEWLEPYRQRFAPSVIDTREYLQEAIRQRKKIVLEGANGALLDLDQGTYPYVTSSSTTIGGVLTGTGLNHRQIGRVIGVIKAYTSRVGEGPFPTESELYEDIKQFKKGERTITEEEEKIVREGTGWESGYDRFFSRWIRESAEEFGATTGRPRRIGWLDLVAVKKAVQINGCNYYALTRLDNLDGTFRVKVCTAYQHKETGEKTEIFPSDTEELANYEPVYEIIPGWKSTKGMRSFAELPGSAQWYVNLTSECLNIPPALLKNGPLQDDRIEMFKLW
ncbi:MAG: adenylosuccinate synthase [Nanoarchaeota archaeon]|nr:adenylosuccinate synthase [Nanoarchaeota archaeon]